MTKYKLITLDMDGTLLNSQKKISKPTVLAIKKALEANKYVVLSTGRAVAELNDYENELSSIQYGILESGALIYDLKNKKIIHQEHIPSKMIERILETASQDDIMICIITNGTSIVSKKNLNEMEKYHMGIYQPMYQRVTTVVDDIYSCAKNYPIEKINLYHQNEKAREKSYQLLKELPLTFAFAETTSLEISPLNVTKASGLIKLCDYLNIKTDETIAVGDAYNDYDVLKTAGLAIAMQNANKDIKEICDVVVSDNDHDGCKEAIENYLI